MFMTGSYLVSKLTRSVAEAVRPLAMPPNLSKEKLPELVEEQTAQTFSQRNLDSGSRCSTIP
jgi:hypothetical protein